MNLNFGSPSADDLRALGWAVTVHNDYRLNGEACTFWALSKSFAPEDEFTVSLKGEGSSDAFALDQIRSLVPAVTERHEKRVALERAFRRLG